MPPRPQGRQQRRVPGATPRDPRFVRARDGGARSRTTLAQRLRAVVRVCAVGGLLLGSVSQAVLQRAECPVAVVR